VREQIRLWPDNGTELFKGACGLAQCLPALPEDTPARDREALAREAIATLKKAIGAGWSDIASAVRDRELDPLRDRADFHQLQDELFDRAFPTEPFAK
jgi:hypothetical protein